MLSVSDFLILLVQLNSLNNEATQSDYFNAQPTSFKV